MNQTFNAQKSDNTVRMAIIGRDGCDRMFLRSYDVVQSHYLFELALRFGHVNSYQFTELCFFPFI